MVKIMDTFKRAQEISDSIEKELMTNPDKHRILTGERPTGNLHLGHYFGSLVNRIKLQQMGLELFVLIADQQVLTDHDSCDKISFLTRELVIDNISAGVDLQRDNAFVFPHSQIPELNQLLVPFLTLISLPELERNPTVKDEIQSAHMESVDVGMLVYPAHQACDILSINADIIPVGKDQLAHLELTRLIARRFNRKFCPEDKPLFRGPNALLSQTPSLVGLDGRQKMSKSRNNSIMLKSTREEIVAVVKKAVTDSEKTITYEPERRPEVANLLFLISLMSSKNPEDIARDIGDGGAKMLKDMLIETTDKFLEPLRERRRELEDSPRIVTDILRRGIDRARSIATDTLNSVLAAMNMKFDG